MIHGRRPAGAARPFLEREGQLEILQSAYDAAQAGAGCMVFIEGEAGAGKTTLVRHFAGVSPEKTVLFGACDPLETPRPLGALLDIAPELSRRAGRPLPDAATREELFSFIARALHGAGRPMVLVFEDVHWADQATIDLLRYIGRRLDRMRALILATLREEEVMPRSGIALLLGDLATASDVHRLSVPPLSRHATAEMVAGSRLDPNLTYERTGGNPFFIGEVLNARTGVVPATVRDAVLARVARLSQAAGMALEAAAAIGSRPPPALLAAILREAGSPHWGIQEAVAAGILVWRDEALAFRHDLARSAIAEASEPARRQHLHALVLAELRRAPIHEDGYAELVLHAEAAGDDATVLELAPLAADRAARLSAHREAADLLRKALERAHELASETRAELFERQAGEYDLSGQLEAAITAFEQAERLRLGTGDALGRARNLSRISRLRFLAGQYAGSETARLEALHVLEGLPPGRELAIAYEGTARLKFMESDAQSAVEWAERAEAIARGAGDEVLLLDARVTLHASRLLRGDEDGQRLLEAELADARRQGLEGIAARATLYLGWLPILQRGYEGVEARLTEGLRYALDHELGYWEQLIVSATVRCALDRGRWHDVEDQAPKVLERQDLVSLARLQTLVAWGRLKARRGEADASRLLDEALAVARQHRAAEAVVLVWPARAEAAWLAGGGEAVIAEAREAREEGAGARNPWWHGEMAFWVQAAGGSPAPPVAPAPPFALSLQGDWSGASRWWTERGCPYEAAVALLFASEPEPVHEAVAALDELGARAAAAYGRRRLRELGVRKVPRGPRPSTAGNRAGLTRREQDVLLLVAGGLSNPEIARRLFLSPKTVERHVSGILRKLDAGTRVEAVAAASTLGLLRRPEHVDQDHLRR